jgi:hypothetical protein
MNDLLIRSRSPNPLLRAISSGFHDLLNDLDKRLVILDINSWINRRLPAVTGNQGQTVSA